jgi:hypothetical protein
MGVTGSDPSEHRPREKQEIREGADSGSGSRPARSSVRTVAPAFTSMAIMRPGGFHDGVYLALVLGAVVIQAGAF